MFAFKAAKGKFTISKEATNKCLNKTEKKFS
jgi:hypothetical protein